jgi:hypothetical protein
LVLNIQKVDSSPEKSTSTPINPSPPQKRGFRKFSSDMKEEPVIKPIAKLNTLPSVNISNTVPQKAKV